MSRKIPLRARDGSIRMPPDLAIVEDLPLVEWSDERGLSPEAVQDQYEIVR